MGKAGASTCRADLGGPATRRPNGAPSASPADTRQALPGPKRALQSEESPMRQADPVDPTPQSRGGRARRLRTVRNVRSFVADVLREVEAHGEPGDPARARVMLYGAQVLGGLITGAEVEQRLEQLERTDAARKAVAELTVEDRASRVGALLHKALARANGSPRDV